VSNGTFVKNQFFGDFFGFHGNYSPFLYKIWSLRAVIIKVKFAFFSIVSEGSIFCRNEYKGLHIWEKMSRPFSKKRASQKIKSFINN
jgi:hypothetical protein